ncbi:hypothetical protein BDW71DRAFT_197982 [Aspergillus fruticulosus]
MVNTGKRSGCCFACRRRRVKCDLEKPCCRRCMDSGRVCPGYPEAWDLMLRMQNNHVEKTVQARVEKVLKTRRRERFRGRTPIASIPQGVHIPVEVLSWNQFCSDYAMGSGITFFNILPRYYTDSTPTCCREAVHAVALASLARKLRESELTARARQHYSKAIAALNIALNDPVLTADDSVLVTLLLFSLFETIVPDYLENMLLDSDFRCHIHFRGAIMLLRWRFENGRHSVLDRRILAFFSHICFMSTFVDYELSDAKWFSFEELTAPWTSDPLLEPVLSRAIHFKRRAQIQFTATGSQSPRLEVLPQLIRDGFTISEELEAAAISVRRSSDPNMPSHQQLTAFNGMFEVSTKTTEAIVRSLYRTVRYRVVELVRGLVARIGDGEDYSASCEFDSQVCSSEELAMILEQIHGDICAVLGLDPEHHAGDDNQGMAHRVFGMFFPITVLMFSSSAGEEKRVWFQEKLRCMGEKTGLGLATWAAQKWNSHLCIPY